MLKWILILLKALTVIPAIVSMKRAEYRQAASAGKYYDAQQAKHRIEKEASEVMNRLIKEKSDLDKMVRKVVEQRDEINKTLYKKSRNPETCICRGCTVLRGLTHGYADRMRGAIRRDIEAESA